MNEDMREMEKITEYLEKLEAEDTLISLREEAIEFLQLQEEGLIEIEENVSQRLDIFLTTQAEHFSRKEVQTAISEGRVRVNGKMVKPKYQAKKGDIIYFMRQKAMEYEILAEDISLDIVYEDADMLVVNKPSGMVVHPAVGHYSGTLVNALMYHCKDSLSGINGVMRPGIVHRIDQFTEGLLLVAKTDQAHQSLAKQLAEHTITRKYQAIVMNGFSEDFGTIDQPIGRNPKDRQKMAVTQKHSRHAITHYKVLERLGNYTHIEAQLETGRTHQIRVHMTYIGHPLLGDVVYGSKKQPFKIEGQALHAKILGFIHPTTGEYMEFEAKTPKAFEAVLKRLQGK